MEVGGMKTRWLFVDKLELGKKYLVEVAGSGNHKSRKKGTEVPYVVVVGSMADGVAREYQISTWNIESEKPFDSEKGARFNVSRTSEDKFFFEPI